MSLGSIADRARLAFGDWWDRQPGPQLTLVERSIRRAAAWSGFCEATQRVECARIDGEDALLSFLKEKKVAGADDLHAAICARFAILKVSQL